MNKNIVLIGMPGAGKSTIGVLLAKTLKKTFIDTDLLIQQKENDFLQNIINKNGIKYFLSLEERIVVSLEAENHVIATGGSVIYSDRASSHLKKGGILIYLKLPYEIIEKRIKNIKTRGIAMENGQSLSDLFMERKQLYEKYSDYALECYQKDSEEIIEEIISIYKKTY
ncbi:MAG: shikimate kinase [Bacillota bacterium]|nr:shikimate kinase [Bacillota bacterium]